MNVLVATDGSRYGRWALDWVAMVPFVEPVKVIALHVLDFRALQSPYLEEHRRTPGEPQRDITSLRQGGIDEELFDAISEFEAQANG